MKKQSFILAVAIATFTLTACGEKTQTPEEMKIAVKNEIQKAQEDFNASMPKDSVGTREDLIKLATKAKKIDSLKKELKAIK